MISWYFHAAVICSALIKMKTILTKNIYTNPHEIAEHPPVFHVLSYIDSIFTLGSHFIFPDFKRHYNWALWKIRLISTPFLECLCVLFQQNDRDEIYSC